MAPRGLQGFAGSGPMSQLGRYWIFFVIVAVGLALSWGQVGRKAQRVFDTAPVVFLHTETPCRPELAPCAAVAVDRALVLGPAQNGLRVKQAGLRDADITMAAATFLAGDGAELGDEVLIRGADAWLIRRLPEAARSLRLRFLTDAETTMAEFPVQASSGVSGR